MQAKTHQLQEQLKAQTIAATQAEVKLADATAAVESQMPDAVTAAAGADATAAGA